MTTWWPLTVFAACTAGMYAAAFLGTDWVLLPLGAMLAVAWRMWTAPLPGRHER